MFLTVAIICIVVSLLFFLFGFLIWRKKKFSLIAGYSEKTFKGDKDRLAKSIGLFVIGIGVLTLTLPFSLEYIGPLTGMIYTVVVVLATIAIVIYVNSINKIN